MITNLLFFLLSAIALLTASFFLVKSLSRISNFLRVSEFTSAFILMAIATSIPELFIGISSAIAKSPSLSLGNLIGASILDLTLLMGIFVLLGKGIRLKHEEEKDMRLTLVAILLLFILFVIGNSLSRFDGMLLIFFFIYNVYRIAKKRKRYSTKLKANIKKHIAIISVVVFLLSLLILFIASRYTVKYASLLAEELAFPKILVGIFLLSFATTLPELVFGIEACLLKHKSMAVGNQTGTIIINLCLIAGIVALIHPIEAVFMPFLISTIFLFIVAFIFYIFVKSGDRLEIGEGIALILLYALFVSIEFFVR